MFKLKEYHFWFITLIAVFISFTIISKKFSTTNSKIDLREILIKDNCIKRALFPSKNNIRQILIALIKQEQKSIKAALFLLTDQYIAKALIEARNVRNVNVEIISCYSNLQNDFNKIDMLKDNNLIVHIFQPQKKSTSSPIMHNKFFIFEKNLDDKSILWTGSFNCTVRAQEKNKENVLVLEDKYLIDLYKDEFEEIKKQTKTFNSQNKETDEKYKNKKLSLTEKFKETYHIFTD